MRYAILIFGLAFVGCNGEPGFGQFPQQVVVPAPFQITFPTEGGVAGARPQIRWSAAPGATSYELSVWRNASLTDLADFQHVNDTQATVRNALPSGSTAYAEVRARTGFSKVTTGIVSFTVGGVPHLPAFTEGNRLVNLASPGGSALALLDVAGNATWSHVHAGPDAIVDARVLPHGVVYMTATGAHEVSWDGLPLWDGPGGTFVDSLGQTTLVDAAGMEIGAWPSQGAGAPVEVLAPVLIDGQPFEVVWAVTTNG